MNGPNDRRNDEDVERPPDERAAPDGPQDGDAARIEAESNLSWREREALLPDSYVAEAAADSGLVPDADGDVERATDDADTAPDTPDGPVVRE